jgi:hypothetical protein
MTFFQKLESFINKYGLYLVFIFLYAWRPLNLGFYSDDWATIVGVNNIYKPFSIDLWHYYLNTFLNRPGQIPTFFFLSSIFQNNPIIWQFTCAILMLISAITLKKMLVKFLNLINIKKTLITVIIASFWLSLPWMLGVTAWVVCVPAILSSIFFFLSVIFLLNGWQKNKISLFFPTTFLLISYLLYEAFFFQYFIFFIFTIILKKKILKWKNIIFPFIFLSISQSITILWNRFATTNNTPVKTFYSDWWKMFSGYTQSLPQLLLNSATEFRYPIEISIKILLVIFFISLTIGLFQKKYKKIVIKFSLLIIFSFIGYLISIWIYSITGYGIFSLGPLSRTTLSLSFWLIMILFFITTFCSIVLPIILKKIFYFVIFCLLIFMILSTFFRTMDWSKAWQLQQTILSQVPIDKLIKVEKDATIVYITPNVVNEAFVFLAGYDLNNAIHDKYPEIGSVPNFCPHIPQSKGVGKSKIYWNTVSWDGTNLYYNNGLYSKPSKVYIWDYYNHSFYQILKPFLLEDRGFKPYKPID